MAELEILRERERVTRRFFDEMHTLCIRFITLDQEAHPEFDRCVSAIIHMTNPKSWINVSPSLNDVKMLCAFIGDNKLHQNIIKTDLGKCFADSIWNLEIQLRNELVELTALLVRIREQLLRSADREMAIFQQQEKDKHLAVVKQEKVEHEELPDCDVIEMPDNKPRTVEIRTPSKQKPPCICPGAPQHPQPISRVLRDRVIVWEPKKA